MMMLMRMEKVATVRTEDADEDENEDEDAMDDENYDF